MHWSSNNFRKCFNILKLKLKLNARQCSLSGFPCGTLYAGLKQVKICVFVRLLMLLDEDEVSEISQKMGVSRIFCDRGICDFISWMKMKFFWLKLCRWSMKVGWCDERERMPQMWDTSFAIGSLGRFHIMEVVCGQGTSWLLKFCQIYIFVMKGKGRGLKICGMLPLKSTMLIQHILPMIFWGQVAPCSFASDNKWWKGKGKETSTAISSPPPGVQQ